MAKIDISKVAEVLKKNQIEPAVLRRVIEELNIQASPEGDGEEKPPSTKKQFVVIVSDPDCHLPKRDFVGWVVQIPDNESPAAALDKVHRAAHEFNTTKKGRLIPVKTIGEAMESVPAKHFKWADCWVKTKEPVYLVRTNNDLPEPPSVTD